MLWTFVDIWGWLKTRISVPPMPTTIQELVAKLNIEIPQMPAQLISVYDRCQNYLYLFVSNSFNIWSIFTILVPIIIYRSRAIQNCPWKWNLDKIWWSYSPPTKKSLFSGTPCIMFDTKTLGIMCHTTALHDYFALQKPGHAIIAKQGCYFIRIILIKSSPVEKIG